MNFAPVAMGRPAVLPLQTTNPKIRFGHEGHDHEKPVGETPKPAAEAPKPAAEPEKPATPPAAPAKKKPGLLRNPLGLLLIGVAGFFGYQGYQALKPVPAITAESCQATNGTFVTNTEFEADGKTVKKESSQRIPEGQPIPIGPGTTSVTIKIPKEVQDALKELQKQTAPKE